MLDMLDNVLAYEIWKPEELPCEVKMNVGHWAKIDCKVGREFLPYELNTDICDCGVVE